MNQGSPYTGEQRFDDRIFHLTGTSVLTAAKDTALPAFAELVAEPSGYIDHGTIVNQIVTLNVEVSTETVDQGRVPTAKRYYLSGQKGSATGQMQEYQPEMISLASGGTGTPETSDESNTPYAGGVLRVDIGGRLGVERRILLVDQHDPDAVAGADEPYVQYWHTNSNVQSGGSYTRAEVKAYFVIPFTYNFLSMPESGVNLLLKFYAIPNV